MRKHPRGEILGSTTAKEERMSARYFRFESSAIAAVSGNVDVDLDISKGSKKSLRDGSRGVASGLCFHFGRVNVLYSKFPLGRNATSPNVPLDRVTINDSNVPKAIRTVLEWKLFSYKH